MTTADPQLLFTFSTITMQPFEAIRKWRKRDEQEINIGNYVAYQHMEKHFDAAEVIKDIILGLSGR
jgi:hypothetical protein